MNWSLSAWDAAGTCQVADLRDPTDYFNTTGTGVLASIDPDQEVYWESPLINTTAAGAVSVHVDLSWVGFDSDAISNSCITDCIKVVTYSSSLTGVPVPDITYSFSGATIGSGTGNGSGSTFKKGTTTVTLTATNVCGNQSCSFDVVVTDVTAPTITCPPTSFVVANNAGCTYNGSTGTPTASDNCTAVTITGPVPASPYSSGTTSVTWSATDGSSNTATCTQLVTVSSSATATINAGGPTTETGAGLMNGSSWANAFSGSQLQTAINTNCVTEIWVAAGTYKPTTGTDRNISFVMKNGVAIYGGFIGNETLLSERNWGANVTILSGKIGSAGNSDNSYHVIFNNNNG